MLERCWCWDVEKKYGSITLADVKRHADDELPLGLEELLKPNVVRELELGQTKEKEKEKKDVKSIEKQMKQLEDVAKVKKTPLTEIFHLT